MHFMHEDFSWWLQTDKFEFARSFSNSFLLSIRSSSDIFSQEQRSDEVLDASL